MRVPTFLAAYFLVLAAPLVMQAMGGIPLGVDENVGIPSESGLEPDVTPETTPPSHPAPDEDLLGAAPASPPCDEAGCDDSAEWARASEPPLPGTTPSPTEETA